MKKIVLFLMLAILILGCSKEINTPTKKMEQMQIANPASVYCKEQGGTLRIEENEKGQYGICTLPDGAECEEWAYFRGECPKEKAKEEQKEEAKLSNLLKWKKEGLRIQNGVSPFIIIKDNEYYMYYPDKDIMLAKSKDGLNFDKGRIVLENKDPDYMISNPAVIKLKNGKYRMFYERQNMKGIRHRVIYSAISDDGEKWEIEGERFWDYGDGKPDEKFTSVPDIIRLDDGTLRMYYCKGVSSAIAESKDEGLTWKKIKNIDLDVYVLDPDIVRLEDGTYKLFFCTTNDPTLKKQWIALATSSDGINFELEEKELIMPDPSHNNVVDPEVIKIDGKYRMYYGQAKSPEFGFSIMSAVIG